MVRRVHGWNIQCNNWKIAYEHHISEEKERKESRERVPSLLDVFSKDDLHHLYPELFEIATLSLPCL
jgi:hypothetical protein